MHRSEVLVKGEMGSFVSAANRCRPIRSSRLNMQSHPGCGDFVGAIHAAILIYGLSIACIQGSDGS